MAVSLWVSTDRASLPVAWRLYLPEVARHGTRRKETGVSAEIRFQTKPAITLEQIRVAVKREIPVGVVLTDAAYGTDTQFREELTDLGLLYMVGIMSSVTVWKPAPAGLPDAAWKGQGQPTKYLRRNRRHAPVPVKHLALALPQQAWNSRAWCAWQKQRWIIERDYEELKQELGLGHTSSL